MFYKFPLLEMYVSAFTIPCHRIIPYNAISTSSIPPKLNASFCTTNTGLNRLMLTWNRPSKHNECKSTTTYIPFPSTLDTLRSLIPLTSINTTVFSFWTSLQTSTTGKSTWTFSTPFRFFRTSFTSTLKLCTVQLTVRLLRPTGPPLSSSFVIII